MRSVRGGLCSVGTPPPGGVAAAKLKPPQVTRNPLRVLNGRCLPSPRTPGPGCGGPASVLGGVVGCCDFKVVHIRVVFVFKGDELKSQN